MEKVPSTVREEKLILTWGDILYPCSLPQSTNSPQTLHLTLFSPGLVFLSSPIKNSLLSLLSQALVTLVAQPCWDQVYPISMLEWSLQESRDNLKVDPSPHLHPKIISEQLSSNTLVLQVTSAHLSLDCSFPHFYRGDLCFYTVF